MNHKPLLTYIVTKIWIIALLFHTAAGTAIIVMKDGPGISLSVFFVGGLLGLLFSWPAPVILFVFLGECMDQRLPCARMLRRTVLATVVSAIPVWLLFNTVFQSFDAFGWPFFALAVVSGILGLFTNGEIFDNWPPILNLLKKYCHENKNMATLASYSDPNDSILSTVKSKGDLPIEP